MGERSGAIANGSVRLWRALLGVVLTIVAWAMLAGCSGAPVQGGGKDLMQVWQQVGWFVDPSSGVRLKLPDGWSRQGSDRRGADRPADDERAEGQGDGSGDVLVLVRDAGPEARISLDIPDLPPHIPGWIPLGLVRNGYLDYVKKIKTDVRVVEDQRMRMAGAKGQFVKLLTESGSRQEITALVVRGDRVYILRGWGEADDTALRETFDRILVSLRWE